MKKTSEISIFCELGFAIYAAKPLVEYLHKKNIDVFVYTQQENRGVASVYLGIDLDKVYAIESLNSALFSIADYLLKQLLVQTSFSSQHQRIVGFRPGFLGLLGKFFRAFPKPDQRRVNIQYNKVWRLLLRKPVFKTKDVVYFTYSHNTHLLNSAFHNIYTVVESWDHPAKSPFFVMSEKLFVWNSSIASDIEEFQGDMPSEVIYPLKFRYTQELDRASSDKVSLRDYRDELSFIGRQNYILYICTYSSFSGDEYFSHELRLITEIAKICANVGKSLYVRPHPHYRGDEFRQLSDYSCVHIGKPAIKSGFNCIFSESDQKFKLELLRRADLVINVGTTLVLEASLVNENILQLDLDQNDFGGFARASNNYHIRTHLNSLPGVVCVNNENVSSLTDYILGGVDSEFSFELQKWLIPEVSLERSMETIFADMEFN